MLGLSAVLGLVVAILLVAVMAVAVRISRKSDPLPVPANDTASISGESKEPIFSNFE